MATMVRMNIARVVLAAMVGLMLAGCSCLRGTYVDRIHTTRKPTTTEEIDKSNAEFETISREGFSLKKRWSDSGGGSELEYWHFRRPSRPSDMNPPPAPEPKSETSETSQ